jgi:hypothetical protein
MALSGLRWIGGSLGLVMLMGLATSCQKQPGTPEGEDWEGRDRRLKELDTGMATLAKKIKAGVGRPECQESADCRLVGLGAKICDGYRDFLIYSTRTTEETKVLPLVKEFNRLAEEQHQLSFSVPNCGKPVGRIQCVEGGCQPVK